jgi:adenosine deaminase
MYHIGEYIAKYKKLIQIKPDEIFDVDLLKKLQNMMIEMLNKRNIAIESLPTSNLRISYYKNYNEHHIQRWLGLKDKSDPMPMFVLGSDDTGVFATNLRNEYCHVFQALESKYGRNVAIEQIGKLQQNSKVYSFSA